MMGIENAVQKKIGWIGRKQVTVDVKSDDIKKRSLR